MKNIKKFEKYGSQDDDYGYSSYEEDDSDEAGMQHLLYLLRKMFENSGMQVEITSYEYDIEIDVFLHTKERLKDLIQVFEIARKLKKDLLAQYDSEYQIFYKSGQPLISFAFNYGDGDYDDDNSPY